MAPRRIVQALGDFVTSFPATSHFAQANELIWVTGKPSDRGPDWLHCAYKYAANTREYVPERERHQVLLEGNVPKHYVTTNPEVTYRAIDVKDFTGAASDDALTTTKGKFVDDVGELVDGSEWVIARIPRTNDFGLVFKPFIRPFQFSATILCDANTSVETS